MGLISLRWLLVQLLFQCLIVSIEVSGFQLKLNTNRCTLLAIYLRSNYDTKEPMLNSIYDATWPHQTTMTWCRHQMETFSALLALCAGNSPVNSPHNGQWRGALMFSRICAWIKGWINNLEAGDLRRHRAHNDDTVMFSWSPCWRLYYTTNDAKLMATPFLLNCFYNWLFLSTCIIAGNASITGRCIITSVSETTPFSWHKMIGYPGGLNKDEKFMKENIWSGNEAWIIKHIWCTT